MAQYEVHRTYVIDLPDDLNELSQVAAKAADLGGMPPEDIGIMITHPYGLCTAIAEQFDIGEWNNPMKLTFQGPDSDLSNYTGEATDPQATIICYQQEVRRLEGSD